MIGSNPSGSIRRLGDNGSTLLWYRRGLGSTPKGGLLASEVHVVERLSCKEDVAGSSPAVGFFEGGVSDEDYPCCPHVYCVVLVAGL